MKTLVRILSIAGLGLGFAVAANAASVRFDTSLQGDVMGCKKCDKDKKEGEGKEAPKPQSLWAGAFSADVVHCGSCDKDKKECPKDGDKKECPKDGDKKTSTMSNLGECNKDKKECPKDGDKKTSTMSNLGECNKDKKECPKDKDKDKQTADNEKKEGECPSGGCGKKKQS